MITEVQTVPFSKLVASDEINSRPKTREGLDTTLELVREAVDEHPWLYRTEDSDPQKDFIESEGSDD